MLVHCSYFLVFSCCSDTYGSYSGKGMYGNHASINYVFGHLGSSNKNSSVYNNSLYNSLVTNFPTSI